jgi:hydroxymethylpyrimidine pyrophosphatase-like HAD family hydrolase
MLPFEVPLVTTNGAVIRSRSGETFMRRLLGVEPARCILDAAEEFAAYTVVVYDQPGPGHLRIQAGPNGDAAADKVSGGVADSGWIRRHEGMVQRFSSLVQALDGDPLEILFTGPMSVIVELGRRLGIGLKHEAAEANHFRLLRTEYPDRDFAILDAIHGDCSKGHALEHWSQLRGIPAEQIMAIGDNYNDLEMLRFAGFPVVMGNAEEELKQNGWPITLDCDSSGVAHAVRQYVL